MNMEHRLQRLHTLEMPPSPTRLYVLQMNVALLAPTSPFLNKQHLLTLHTLKIRRPSTALSTKKVQTLHFSLMNSQNEDNLASVS